MSSALSLVWCRPSTIMQDVIGILTGITVTLEKIIELALKVQKVDMVSIIIDEVATSQKTVLILQVKSSVINITSSHHKPASGLTAHNLLRTCDDFTGFQRFYHV